MRELSLPQQRRLAQRQDEAAQHKRTMERQDILYGKQNLAIRRWAAEGGPHARRSENPSTATSTDHAEQHAEQSVGTEPPAEGTGTAS